MRDGEAPGAIQAGLRLVARRPHSEAELRRKLARRGYLPAQVEGAVARLRELGYVDDAAFARALVAHRSRRRGPSLIADELVARGVDRELAVAALAEVAAEELVAARRLVERSGALDSRQLAARLQRRGFSADVIRRALAGQELDEE